MTVPSDTTVFKCCEANPTTLVFNVRCKGDERVLVLACAEHELQTGVLLSSLGVIEK